MHRSSSQVLFFLCAGMENLVTGGAERDEILLDVPSEPTPRADVVDLELVQSTTALAAPPVPLENLLVQSSVRLATQS